MLSRLIFNHTVARLAASARGNFTQRVSVHSELHGALPTQYRLQTQRRWIRVGVPVILQSPNPRSAGGGAGKYTPDGMTETTIEARLDKAVVSPATNSIQFSIHFTSPNLAAPAMVKVNIGLDAIQHVLKPSSTLMPGSTTLLPVPTMCPPPALSATCTLPTLPPTNDVSRVGTDHATARALRFMQVYAKHTGNQPRFHILDDGRYYFDAEQIAALYSPKLKHPRDAAKRHLGKYSGSDVDGIRSVGKVIVGTIDALLERMVARMRGVRDDISF